MLRLHSAYKVRYNILYSELTNAKSRIHILLKGISREHHWERKIRSCLPIKKGWQRICTQVAAKGRKLKSKFM